MYLGFFLLQVKAILNTLEEAGIQIGEDPVFEKGFRPGINYDGPNRIGERKRPEDVQIIWIKIQQFFNVIGW